MEANRKEMVSTILRDAEIAYTPGNIWSLFDGFRSVESEVCLPLSLCCPVDALFTFGRQLVERLIDIRFMLRYFRGRVLNPSVHERSRTDRT